MHLDKLTKKLKAKLVFLFTNRPCFYLGLSRRLVLPVFDYGNMIYMQVQAAYVVKPLDSVYPSTVHFTGRIHHCLLYQPVSWLTLTSRKAQYWLLFVYKAVLLKIPAYLTSLLT